MAQRPIAGRVEELQEALNNLSRHNIKVTESISRLRTEPFAHDRHFSTQTTFQFRLEYYGMSISGLQLRLENNDDINYVCYGIALEAVVDFIVEDDGSLILIEYFEQKTERRTTIKKMQDSEQS